jgi:hypothetical protein
MQKKYITKDGQETKRKTGCGLLETEKGNANKIADELFGLPKSA